MILILSRRFSLYITDPRTLKILKDFNLIKFNLSLGLVVQINVIFIFSVFCRRYTLFFFLRVGPQTLFLSVKFFIVLLKNTKFCYSFFYNLQISSTIIIIYSTNFSYFFIFSKMSALNSLFIKNRVLLVMLCSEVLYARILIDNSLTQLVYQQSQKYLRYYFSVWFIRLVCSSICG